MFDRMKTYLRRVKTMSFKRMAMYAKLAGAEFKKPKLFVMVDMVICSLRFNVGYLDYHTFGFAGLNAAQRATFMTMVDNQRVIRAVNDGAKRDLFEDKRQFLATFGPQAKRDWLDLETAAFEDFEAFTAKHGVFFAKETDSYGGLGVSRMETAGTDPKALWNALRTTRRFLVEEAVVQDERVAALFPLSVNTVRMVTLCKDGEVHLLYALIRMGSGESRVDNISSGGMYAPLDENGVIRAKAFCDKTGEYYAVHPTTDTPIVGFALPRFDEAVALVKEAALVVPEVRYVGWDVAFSDKGPLLIEGNTIPSYDMCQNHNHLVDPKWASSPASRP